MSDLLSFDPVQCGLIITALLLAGDYLSGKIRLIIPSFLISGLLFMFLSWSGFIPKDFIDISGFAALASIANMFIIVHMGASLSLKQFAANWKVVVLAATIFVCQLLTLFFIVGRIYGINLALGGLPGGSATALIVQERARQFGYDDIIVLSVLFYSTQSLAACPITVICSRIESKRLLNEYVSGTSHVSSADGSDRTRKDSSRYLVLCKMYLTAWLAVRLEAITGIPKYVLCLILGVVLASAGFLEKDLLSGSKSENFLFLMLMGMLVSGFSRCTPQMFTSMMVPLLIVLGVELLTITCVGLLIGRILGFSPAMSIGLGTNIMVGFPPNLILTTDVAKSLTSDSEELAYLHENVSAKMVISGLTTTTFLATLSAGILVNLMK